MNCKNCGEPIVHTFDHGPSWSHYRCNDECSDAVGEPWGGSLTEALDDLERTDPAVAKASAALDEVYEHLKGKLSAPQVAAIYDLEHPYIETLEEDERRGH